jgi:hypothetical protein
MYYKVNSANDVKEIIVFYSRKSLKVIYTLSGRNFDIFAVKLDVIYYSHYPLKDKKNFYHYKSSPKEMNDSFYSEGPL